MCRIRLLSSPPAIAIDDEPLGGVDHGDRPPIPVGGFELVPAWQVTPARGGRRLLAALPVLAVAAAVALLLDRGHDPTPTRAAPVRPTAPARAALVVQASSGSATDGSRARR